MTLRNLKCQAIRARSRNPVAHLSQPYRVRCNKRAKGRYVACIAVMRNAVHTAQRSAAERIGVRNTTRAAARSNVPTVGWHISHSVRAPPAQVAPPIMGALIAAARITARAA